MPQPLHNFTVDSPVNVESEPYLKEFADFMEEYGNTEKSADDVGVTLTRFAQYYAMYSLKLTAATRRMSLKAQAISTSYDDNGKPITAAKAQFLCDATDEALLVNLVKTHVNNVEGFLSALRALQKGLMNEYNHMANT